MTALLRKVDSVNRPHLGLARGKLLLQKKKYALIAERTHPKLTSVTSFDCILDA